MRCKVLLPVLTAAMILVIWGHSMMPGDMSSGESGFVADIVRALFSLEGEDVEHFIRKCAHFFEYMVLGIMVLLDVYVLTKKLFHMSAPFLGLFVPCVDETIQIFSVDRNGVLPDVWLDFSGYVTGFALCALICCAISKYKRISQKRCR